MDNCIKAFSVYSFSSPEFSEAAVPEDSGDMEENEFVFVDLDVLLQVGDESTEVLTQVQYELPPHQKCATRTLNLVLSTVFINI